MRRPTNGPPLPTTSPGVPCVLTSEDPLSASPCWSNMFLEGFRPTKKTWWLSPPFPPCTPFPHDRCIFFFLQLSCDVLPTQARLPKVRFLLAAVGNRPPKPTQGRVGTGAPLHPPKGPTRRPSPEGRGLNQVSVEENTPGARHTIAGRGAVGLDRRRAAMSGVYRLLQRERDNALLRDPLPSTSDRTGTHAEPTTATPTAAKTWGKDKCTAVREERSEVGAGRALFGGFVPSRQAPAASLYDFGTGDGSTVGGVSALGSIYGRGGAGRGGVGMGQGTMQTLDNARVRHLTQEATARAQRLGAEKRNSRVTKSKRKG